MSCGKTYKEAGYESALNEDNYMVNIIMSLLLNIIAAY